jgi:PAS domain S-box-containing protein
MKGSHNSIQKKLRRVILITCGIVLLLTCAASFTYEYFTYRNISKRALSTLGKIVAANSTAALAFDNKEDADEILSALTAQQHLVVACLYDKDGQVFAVYPKTLSPKNYPSLLQQEGYVFRNGFIEGFEPVKEGEDHLGTLFLRSDMQEVYGRFRLYGIMALLSILVSFLLAYQLAKRLQKSISTPILKLAETARIVSDHKDYSVRATKESEDEIGLLTDAFNHMLTQIERQNAEINAWTANLEEKVTIRTGELQKANSILQQQNEFIQTIIDSSVDIIAVFNKKLEYVILNKQAEITYKRGKEEFIGRSLFEIFPRLKGTAMAGNLNRALAGEFVHDEMYKSVVSDRYFENFFIPLKDKDDNTERVLVIAHDISTIMQANEKLKLMNTELEKSNQELEQFAYVASHDLQEPLRKIQTFSDLCEKNIPYPDILKRYLQKINSSAGRMSNLISAVLNYSRLAKDGQEFKPVDLNEVVANIRNDLELVIEEKKAIITTSHLPVIPAIQLQMGQLFLNLISNSLKFCKNQPRISITAKTITAQEVATKVILKKASYTELIVEDNGIGFEQQYASRIFSIFQRLHSGSEFAGTGIGLALCKKIVENHGGAITVQSEPGKGTKFFIYLPLAPDFKEQGAAMQQVSD